ncbi:Putative chromosome segregation protein (SMC). Homolog to OMM_6 MMP and DMR_40880 of RS-1 (with bad E-value) [Desulfamplus magnetovallimortis]|uniref:Putative chromosome segregation protein (SMC). Homolog to OMM_6 MMP and DMR_40880 of RS-1 (With bad E-value) n=1 Tax=Desulfamplus magnetovallimortis TaxID=1246637 RepID=L0R4C5_9BACT|nr:hypothetical protein [Desulfamplus magnetovallimortis]CCO06724.1 Putative chromosome segregation protein (SMC). Homolog to OMM_6 MMP and DMR_40880 of RS-1 (with bad E-value) [Desulfamplus magnetovallimortis BW-1]SLM32775.1 Putative chromosome segregation protein (SMC). Homolog to OMM_6 MMP and DMR_40880 of RS-1 (with bad E-value) [Desulfamplus magnetovallimortis]
MDESGLSPETQLLISEIKRLEQEDRELTGQMDTIQKELDLHKKSTALLHIKLNELKETLSGFISEEDNLLHHKKFLESEREQLETTLNKVSDKYDENMAILEDLMTDVEFMKGEIETLQSKTQILETEIPYKFKDSENLDKRVKVTFFRALENLEKRINDVQKRAEVIYYKKGEI